MVRSVLTFSATPYPCPEHTARMAQLEPFAPHNTEEYILAQKQLGETPFVLGLYQGETMVAGCAAFLTSGWLGKRVEIPSLPALPDAEQFFAGLSEFCRCHRVWDLVLGSFGSSEVVLPTIGRLLEKQNRFEFVIELDNLDTLKLSNNHKRNMNRAHKAGVAIKRTNNPNAITLHLELMGASMARREVRNEDVSGAIKESVMRAMLEAAVGEFFQAYAGTQILSSIFILKSSKVGYYHSAGTSPKGMELGTSPFLVYSAAELLSKDGFRELNLGGAEPENPGLYRFKKGFGAVEQRLEAAIFSLAPPILHRVRSALRLMRRDPKGFLRMLIPEMITKSKRIIRKFLPDPVIQKYRAFQIRRTLPERVRKARRQDFVGVPAFDSGPEAAILANLSWIGRAQDCSATADGDVARHFSLVNGWGPSYPETTGYIVPTMLAEAKIQDDAALRRRAERMLDWLVAIQLPEGAFQGGMITHKPVVPVTFNTGQILLGLAAGTRASRKEDYLSAMHRAATWLVETQDADGCWRRFPTPFAKISEKAYETHVSWSLFEAERVSPGRGYGEAGLKQVHWALTKQQDNSWFRDCCLNDPIRPLTHTIGYALRGVLEAYRLSQNEVFLDAGVRTADALIHCVKSDGFLAGCLDSHWRSVVDWVCLTGSVQIAYCWFLLFGWTGDTRYFDAGRKVNSYVRRTIAVEGDPDLVGGVRGSFPISGAYGNYEYLNWAAKFCIDSFRKEIELTEQGAAC